MRPSVQDIGMPISAIIIIALGCFAAVLLSYAILTAYLIPAVKFIRSGIRENRQRQAALEAWREERGFPRKTAWWVSDGSLEDAIFWFSLPISIVLGIYIFFY